jgi:predicted methyltransferase
MRAPFAFAFALAAFAPVVTLGCASSPPPRDLSNASPIPIHNTAAIVENTHATTEIDDAPRALAVLAAPDRSEADRALDARRQAADVLTYLGLSPGMRVVELASGGGYFTELIARSVAPNGEVLAENPPSMLDRMGIRAAWDARAARLGGGVERVDGELGAPLPVRDADLVFLALFHRDLPSYGVDAGAVDGAAFAALRSGGRYVVVDRAPPEGKRRADLTALHVEESTNARRSAERAGFRFVNEGRFLRSSTNDADWNATPAASPTPLETQDRFFLTFVKP